MKNKSRGIIKKINRRTIKEITLDLTRLINNKQDNSLYAEHLRSKLRTYY